VPARPSGVSRQHSAPAVGGLFFPPSKSLGMDRTRFSAALQATITFAGTRHPSCQLAEEDLLVLAEVDVVDKHVRRLCQTIGAERLAERAAAVSTSQAKPLTERKGLPEGVPAPAVAVVGVAGGRRQIFERVPKGQEAPAASAPAEDMQDDVAVPEWKLITNRHVLIGLSFRVDQETGSRPLPWPLPIWSGPTGKPMRFQPFLEPASGRGEFSARGWLGGFPELFGDPHHGRARDPGRWRGRYLAGLTRCAPLMGNPINRTSTGPWTAAAARTDTAAPSRRRPGADASPRPGSRAPSAGRGRAGC